MPVRNQNWYDLQEGRRYPLDDLSTGIDDNGDPIADNIIVDCHVRFPNTLGEYAYVSALHVSDNIVTLIIHATASLDNTAEFKPIAAISLAKPIETGVNQPITPLVPGVAGWVTFGSGIGVNFAGKYSTPIQSFISPRCARPYRPLPIPTLGKINLATALSGMVKILAKNPVAATYELTTVEGKEVPAIVFRLVGDLAVYNPLKEYGGPCKARPESGTCKKPGLENINGVKPDCDGNIQISTNGFSLLPFVDDTGACGGGFDLITDQGLSETCAETPPYRKRRDLCVPDASEDSDGFVYWPDPTDQIPVPPDIVSSISIGDPDIFGSCYPENTCFDFAGGTASMFLTKSGLFVFEEIEAIDTCDTDTESASTGVRYAYVAADVSGNNVTILRNCNANINTQNTVSTILKLGSGPRRNGGIILNYMPADPFTRTPTTFTAAVLDIDGGGLQIIRYNGTNFIVEARANFSIRMPDWYELSASIQAQTGGVLVTATARNIMNAENTTALSTVVSQFGTPTSTLGLFSNRAYTYFSKFVIGG